MFVPTRTDSPSGAHHERSAQPQPLVLLNQMVARIGGATAETANTLHSGTPLMNFIVGQLCHTHTLS